ncbi:helix-turn-helix domain-containing protein [Staphylococcus xylosus]|uniref:helix-turn-helix domain-containing protein n=1 Tax=Staphylococcus xylosus TaxID=1288 RepID=UPI000733F3D2|nr:helix-turn-helix domain-containing protein [Staphylococcus xylosus]
MRQFTTEEIQQIVKMYHQGYSFGEIGKQLGRRGQAIGRKVKKLGLSREIVMITCESCGEEFEKHLNTSVEQKYCSENCKHRALRKRNPKPPKIENCRYCNNSFISKYASQYCSDECRKLEAQRIKNSKRKIRIVKCRDCSNRFVKTNAKILCGKCTKDFNNIRMTRARQNGQFDADIDIYKLIERDGKQCYLCGDAVSFDCHYNSPKYPTIEHVLAIANGGTHSWENVKVACRDCNTRKGTKTLKEVM